MGIMSLATIAQHVHVYKKFHGVQPPWYKVDGKQSYVDIDILMRYDTIEHASYHYNTNSLYWVFKDCLGVSQSQLAAYMAKESNNFKSMDSWSMFLSRDMWGEPAKSKISHSLTKHVELTIYGSKLANNIIKLNKSQGNDLLTCDIILLPKELYD
jgi:hypothetical protein